MHAQKLATDDVTPSNFTLVSTPAHSDLSICFDALAALVYADPDIPATSVQDIRTLLGPRHALLEASPCAAYKQRIPLLPVLASSLMGAMVLSTWDVLV